ncbi:hypothetical protein CVT24_005551 [Panaeolus cyanescens]|uniref:Uncharacterized protein n=1 Tax=Panaeolus cyanescens TaxID=181874 RepID=A0A409YBV3_9AGAR|nr:hypothetical protein CVT24_005551 [Panaeolus cyanescens]
MPAPVQTYDVILTLVNDMHDMLSIQLLQDYGRCPSKCVVLQPGESQMLILESGGVYQYALKSRTKVANVSVRSWRDTHHLASHIFTTRIPTDRDSPSRSSTQLGAVRVDRLWMDTRFDVWNSL